MKVFRLLGIQFIIFATSLLMLGSSVFAQEIQLYDESDIIVDVSPEVPGPNEEVTLRLKSYSFNLNNYFIVWYENGEQKAADYGNKEFKFKTGSSGSITSVTAVLDIGDQSFRKELRFSPSQVDLLWEAIDAYTPPFYKGKALPIQQSALRITAIPETLLLAPSDAPKLVYYWDRNYQRDINKSGFGRQSFTINGDPLIETEKITVMTNDRRENSFATSTITIPMDAYKPKILFYQENEQGRILTNKALNTNSSVVGDTIKLSFHPLNMSSTQENFIDMFVNWNINNEEQAPQDFDHQNELHITTEGQAGAVPISVTLEGITKIMQTHTENMTLIFSNL
jgi:hypothetical protein